MVGSEARDGAMSYDSVDVSLCWLVYMEECVREACGKTREGCEAAAVNLSSRGRVYEEEESE